MLETISIELALTLGAIIVAVVGWEWKKVLGDRKTETALKEQFQKEIQSLKEEMKSLHDEHQKLLRGRDGEHSDVMRKMTTALNNLNGGIHELTHYIQHLGKVQTGHDLPPPLPRSG